MILFFCENKGKRLVLCPFENDVNIRIGKMWTHPQATFSHELLRMDTLALVNHTHYIHHLFSNTLGAI